MIRTALLVVTDEDNFDGEHSSLSVIRELLHQSGVYQEVDFQSVPREQAIIRAKLRMWADNNPVDLVLTTGGSALAARDRTPEATLETIEREAAGIARLSQLLTMNKDRSAALYRPVCGIRRQTLMLNLPDEPEHVRYALSAVIQVLPRALANMQLSIN